MIEQTMDRAFDTFSRRMATKRIKLSIALMRLIAAVEMKQKLTSQKLEELRKELRKKRKKFAAEMNAAMNDFEAAYKKAKSNLEK